MSKNIPGSPVLKKIAMNIAMYVARGSPYSQSASVRKRNNLIARVLSRDLHFGRRVEKTPWLLSILCSPSSPFKTVYYLDIFDEIS